MATKLYVGGLAYSVNDQGLEALFTEYGKVVSSAVIKDRDTGQSKGFGFVELEDADAAQKAIAAMNGKDVDGRSITVNEARPQVDRGNRGGGGGGFNKSY
jgi:RNA recognition motif-containing protein